MARIDITQADVLEAVCARLRSFLSLNARSCYIVVDRMSPGQPMSGNYWLTVSLGDGSFDDTLADGGGVNQITEYVPVIVAGYSRVKLDATNIDQDLLLEDTRGLLIIKKNILRALTQRDLAEPEDENTFLRELLIPSSAEAPMIMTPAKAPDGQFGIGMVSVTFTAVYDWDLT